jgi:pyruvate/2-oxoglutarate dehydrogenase complex dihydrolipoamide dehydrogenase (E3) component
MTQTHYDVAIIGGGPAGLVVATTAARFGDKVVLFEKGELGGDCLNTGCVPSKSLIAAANAAHAHRASGMFGIAADEPHVDHAAVMRRVREVIESAARHDSQERLQGFGITVVRAEAKFSGSGTIVADGETYAANRFVIATGSRPLIPAIAGLAKVPYLTSDTLFANPIFPTHLAVIGGGPVGLEMAQAHRRLGAQVTVIEAGMPLSREDADLANVIITALERDGVTVYRQTAILSVEANSKNIRLKLEDGRQIDCSHVLVATGRQANTEGLGLDIAGIFHDHRGIMVDRKQRTSNRRVYAAGDIAVPEIGIKSPFTHAASHQASVILRHLLFRLSARTSDLAIPRVTFTDPELAQVGLTEVEARARFGTRVRVTKFALSNNDRAMADGRTEGLIKVVTGGRGRILGAGIAAPHAGEMIGMWSMALNEGMSIAKIAKLILPYPTLSESGKLAALTYYSDLPQRTWVRRVAGLMRWIRSQAHG